MADDLNIRQFFRRAPREWLRRYFEHENVFAGFEWDRPTKKITEALLSGWLALDEDTRSRLLEDFKNIKLLATPAGKMQMIDEARFHNVVDEVTAALNDLGDFYECAFWLKLEQPKCWTGAVLFADADSRSGRYWLKRNNLPVLGRQTTTDDGEALASAIVTLFRRSEARGEHCFVEQYRRGAREYYFAYSQDHKQTSIEYDSSGSIDKRPYRPAFEIIFVHNDEEQSLNIWHDGSRARKRELQVAFAKAVLGQDIEPEAPHDDRVYDLDGFLNPDFDFKPAKELGIATVELRQVRLRVQGSRGFAMTIALDQKTPGNAWPRLREQIMAILPKSSLKVERVELLVTFDAEPTSRKPIKRRFSVTRPNSCTLELDGYGIVIERMLVAHGIELKSAPSPDDADSTS